MSTQTEVVEGHEITTTSPEPATPPIPVEIPSAEPAAPTEKEGEGEGEGETGEEEQKALPGEEEIETLPEEKSSPMVGRIIRQRDRVREQRDNLERQLQTVLASGEIDIGPEPRMESFEDPVDYDRALARWEGQRGASDAHQKIIAKQRQALDGLLRQNEADMYHSQLEEARATIKDFSQITTPLKTMFSRGSPMERCVFTSKHFGRLSVALAQHPEETLRIAELPERELAREIGKIEERIAGRSRQPERDSRAPERKSVV